MLRRLGTIRRKKPKRKEAEEALEVDAAFDVSHYFMDDVADPWAQGGGFCLLNPQGFVLEGLDFRTVLCNLSVKESPFTVLLCDYTCQTCDYTYLGFHAHTHPPPSIPYKKMFYVEMEDSLAMVLVL